MPMSVVGRQRNQSHSERRANRVKTSLVSQGVPEGKIDIVALGERQNLSRADVLKLQDEIPTSLLLRSVTPGRSCGPITAV